MRKQEWKARAKAASARANVAALLASEANDRARVAETQVANIRLLMEAAQALAGQPLVVGDAQVVVEAEPVRVDEWHTMPGMQTARLVVEFHGSDPNLLWAFAQALTGKVQES